MSLLERTILEKLWSKLLSMDGLVDSLAKVNEPRARRLQDRLVAVRPTLHGWLDVDDEEVADARAEC